MTIKTTYARRISIIACLTKISSDYPEAEEFVLDAIKFAAIGPLPESTPDREDTLTPTEKETHTAQFYGKLNAIKAYRNRTGASLKDAKAVIEKHMDVLGLKFHCNYPNN